MGESSKMMLAETLKGTDLRATHFENECEKFGMTWGCRPDCPVFERGECELQEENEEMFKGEELK